MTWAAFHAGAQEVELWLSLAVNCWLILVGIFWLIRRPKSIETIGQFLTAIALFLVLTIVATFFIRYVALDFLDAFRQLRAS